MSDLPDDVLVQIYEKVGPYTRAKAAISQPRVKLLYPDTPDLSQIEFDRIESLIADPDKITDPKEIVSALNTLAPFKIELADVVKVYAKKAANLIKGRTPDEIRDLFGIRYEHI